MKALIFGAEGQVGRALAEAAPNTVHLVRLGRANCDIRSPARVAQAIAETRPDVVFNAAAFTAVDRAETEVEAANAVNAIAPGVVADAARAAGARTVHLSTDHVFDGRADRPYRTDDQTNPQSVYGRTKLAGEAAVRRADPLALIVRTCWLYSSRGSNFATRMLQLMRDGGTLRIVADQTGTPTRAGSLAAALWTLVGAGATGLFHYRDAGQATWHAFAVAIQEEALLLGLLPRTTSIQPIATGEYPAPAPRPPFAVLDASAAWRSTGGPPPHWRTHLRQMLCELRDHG